MTLDSLLLEATLNDHKDKIDLVTTLENWTKENKDELFQQTVDLSSLLTDSAVIEIQRLQDTSDSENSLLYLVLYREVLSGIIDTLESFRQSLDVLSDEELEVAAFSYEWIDEKIRLTKLVNKDTFERIKQLLETNTSIEEL